MRTSSDSASSGDLVLDVLSQLAHERSQRAALRHELADVEAQAGRSARPWRRLRRPWPRRRRSGPTTPWDHGRRVSEAMKVVSEKKRVVEELEEAVRSIKRALA